MTQACAEVVRFIPAGSTTQEVAAFQSSAAVRERAELLIQKEKTEGLLGEEKGG